MNYRDNELILPVIINLSKDIQGYMNKEGEAYIHEIHRKFKEYPVSYVDFALKIAIEKGGCYVKQKNRNGVIIWHYDFYEAS